MTRDEAVAEVAFRLGRRTELNDDILRNMVLQQQILEGSATLPWFLLTSMESLATVSGTEEVAVPDDFLREPEEESALWIYDASADDDEQWVEIPKAQYDEIKIAFSGSGQPERYALVGSYFRLRPIPDDVYALRMIYYAKGTVLSSQEDDLTNVWLTNAPELLIAKTTAKLAGVLGNANALVDAKDSETKELARIHVENTARQEANRSRTMGEAP